MSDSDKDEAQELIKLLEKPNANLEGNGEEAFRVPPEMPIMPLRGLVVYPMTLVPIRVGQPRSIKLLDDVVANHQLVGLVTSQDAELETPGPGDVYRVGTAAAVHRLFRSKDGTITLIMQGLLRVRVEEFVSEQPYLTARVSELRLQVSSLVIASDL